MIGTHQVAEILWWIQVYLEVEEVMEQVAFQIYYFKDSFYYVRVLHVSSFSHRNLGEYAIKRV